MPPQIGSALIGLLGALVGGGITATTTWLIARTERTKFARERIWDLRREAYTKIIASVVPAARIAEHMSQEYRQDPEGYDASVEVKQAAREYVAHFRAAQDAFHIGRLVLSPAFAEAFLEMLHRLGGIASNSELLPPDKAKATHAIMQAESHRLLETALSEIDAGTALTKR